MLLEFSVSNFRSFRGKQTFSMVAAPRLRKKQNTFAAPVDGEKLPSLLKAAAIYGPNAAGKSNLLLALNVVSRIASRTGDMSLWPLPITPFKFDSALINDSSIFELHFLCGRQRYEFRVAATEERITCERLTTYPKGRETLLYERIYADGIDKYTFGDLEGGATVREAWQKLTPPRALFLSQAVLNSSEELQQLRRPHQWISRALFYITARGIGSIAEAALDLSRQHEQHGDNIAKFLRDVDVPVTRIRVRQPDSTSQKQVGALPRHEATSDQPQAGRKIPARRMAVFSHRTALGEAEFGFDEESEGTQNLVGFWLPWTTRDPTPGDERCILAVDELDSSLHPAIVANLVKKHIEAEIPSQLIFSTHDTHLMESGLLRRDQIWIAERDENGATLLRSVYDFEGREGEDLEKRYYEGRYRGLPIVRS